MPSTPARTRRTSSKRFSSRTVEQHPAAGRRRRGRARLRLHERLPRHRELRRDLGRYACAVTPPGRRRVGRREPCRRLRHDGRCEDRGDRDHRHGSRDRADPACGALRRDRVEPRHLVVRPALELHACPDRRPGRSGDRPVRLQRRAVARLWEKVIVPGAISPLVGFAGAFLLVLAHLPLLLQALAGSRESRLPLGQLASGTWVAFSNTRSTSWRRSIAVSPTPPSSTNHRGLVKWCSVTTGVSPRVIAASTPIAIAQRNSAPVGLPAGGCSAPRARRCRIRSNRRARRR